MSGNLVDESDFFDVIMGRFDLQIGSRNLAQLWHGSAFAQKGAALAATTQTRPLLEVVQRWAKLLLATFRYLQYPAPLYE